MSKSDHKALDELRTLIQTRQIRISRADKGGAIVIQDMDSYLQEAHRQLDNMTHYVMINNDPTYQIAKQTNLIIRDLHDNKLIDRNTFRWATIDLNNVRPHIFYHLPKIHKTLSDPPGRPIVSGTGGPTETLSKLIDHWLIDLIPSLPSYIKDITHMLQIISEWNEKFGPFDDNAILVTVDVTSLYTNIPQAEIETAIRHFMALHPNPDIPSIPVVIEAARHVLHNNFFNFEGKTYKQISGTAMGTPMAPTVANLFMGLLESQILDQSPIKINIETWKRFIDDIFILWLGTEQDIDTFVSFLNTFHPTIKFTAKKARDQIPFLDILVKIKNGYLHTDLYTKDTDAHAYLQYTSCHPKHCVNNIPYSQFLRVRRICSEDEDVQRNFDTLTNYFLQRQYPADVITRARNRALSTPRTLNYTKKPQDERVPLVVTHHPANPPLRKWLTELLPVLHSSDRMRKAVPKPPVIGERNCRTLSNILMPSAVPPPLGGPEAGCYKCTLNCKLCRYHLVESKTFHSVETKETFTIRERYSCQTTNVVYLISCSICTNQCQYVGETKNTLRQRFYKHTSDIRNNTGTLVTKHFNQPGHSLSDMQVIVIERVFNIDLHARLRREAFWRNKLRTLTPHGLNSLEEIYSNISNQSV